MSLEGNLRDLELQEVFQLLAHSRKSGELHITAQLAGLAAIVAFDRGAIVNAAIGSLSSREGVRLSLSATKQRVENSALELLTWRDGAFRFAARAATGDDARDTGVRLHTELILVEGARRIETWAKLSNHIPHARTVPAFVGVEPTQLPLLHLVPQQWEVLTRVDGQRDLVALSEALGRDLLDVAEIVHGLIEAGLLTLLDSARAMRTHATPPSSVAGIVEPEITDEAGPGEDVWVPSKSDGHTSLLPHEDDAYDAVFDPVRVGVITPEGLPRLQHRTPSVTRNINVEQTPVRVSVVSSVAAPAADYRALGDAAARRGDLPEALTQWSAYLKLHEHGPEAGHAREAIALSARLHSLLHSSRKG